MTHRQLAQMLRLARRLAELQREHEVADADLVVMRERPDAFLWAWNRGYRGDALRHWARQRELAAHRARVRGEQKHETAKKRRETVKKDSDDRTKAQIELLKQLMKQFGELGAKVAKKSRSGVSGGEP